MLNIHFAQKCAKYPPCNVPAWSTPAISIRGDPGNSTQMGRSASENFLKHPRTMHDLCTIHAQRMHKGCTICALLSAEAHFHRAELGGESGCVGNGQSVLRTPATRSPIELVSMEPGLCTTYRLPLEWVPRELFRRSQVQASAGSANTEEWRRGPR